MITDKNSFKMVSFSYRKNLSLPVHVSPNLSTVFKSNKFWTSLLDASFPILSFKSFKLHGEDMNVS